MQRQQVVAYQKLDVLQEHGIAANDIQKLNNAGMYILLRKYQSLTMQSKQSRIRVAFLSNSFVNWIANFLSVFGFVVFRILYRRIGR